MKKFLVFFLAAVISLSAYSQRGKDGAKTITAVNTIVNEYTALTADASAGAVSIKVTASGLNTNSRFSRTLAAGDLILIYQAQGAQLNGVITTNVYGTPNDSSWGQVLNLENCGQYEFQEVSSVPNGTTINLDCGLKNSYSDTGLVQVVRVPRYLSLTVNAAGVLTAQNWNVSPGVGGILVVEVEGNTVINGKMDVSGLGFRGGKLLDNTSGYGGGYFACMPTGPGVGGGEDKGESIGGFETKYDPLGGHRANGAPANGGGGGRCHNSGGGGGANGGVILNWNGKGNVDNSVGTYVTAWNLESPGFSAHTSSGGGRGGYSFASNAGDPTTTGPVNGAWGGDARKVVGGLGGRPLDYTTGRLFFGGGGGAGDQDNSKGGAGGSGGGLLYLMSYGTITGTGGQVIANGANGGDTQANTIVSNSSDGAGGAGGGGVIVINSVGAVSGFTASANGGAGGKQVETGTISESEGPGGGGGGGYIAISNGAIVQTATGGANGTTNNKSMTPKFPANGATKGDAGTIDQPITNFTITTKTDSVCSGSTATLTATLNGTVPAGTTVMWYAADTGGVAIGSGNPFTTPVINANTVYYAGTCPGTYRVADSIKVVSAPTASAGSPVTICGGGSTLLTATGGTVYSWSPATGLTSTTTASTTASPSLTTTYTVTVSNGVGACSSTATVTVTVNGGSVTPTASAAPSTICKGKTTALTAGGGVSYSWSPVTGLSSTTISNPIATPSGTITYTVTVKDAGGCSGTATTTITVNNRPTANAGTAVSECAGSGVTLNGSGGGSYSWSPSTGLSNSTIANPTATSAGSQTYTLTVVDANGCRDSATVALKVNPKPVVKDGGPSTTICSGGSVGLNATGAATYTWSPGTALTSTTIPNPTANPSSTITYTVVGTDSLGCVNSDTIQVVVGGSITLITSGPVSICPGTGTALSASGATTYSWTPGTGLSSTIISNPTASPTGTQTYTVTGTSGSCSATGTVTVTVYPKPVANAGKDTAYCKGGMAQLSGSGGVSYSWTPSGGLSGTTVSNPTANPASTTTYTLTVTDGNNCTNKDSVKVTVNSLPTLGITGNLNPCSGSGTTLTATGAAVYSWSPAAGLSTSTGSVTTATVATSATYTLTGTDGNSCTSIITTQVVAHPLPPVGVTSNLNTVCSSGCVILNGIDSVGSCSTVLYTYGDGHTGSSPNHCYTSAGSYAVTFTCTDGNGCVGSVTKPNFIQVNPAPVATFSTSTGASEISYTGSKPDSVCFSNTSTGGVSWFWNLGNGTTSTAQQPCVTYADSGRYCVKLTVTGPGATACQSSDSSCITLIRKEPVTYNIPNVFSPNGDGVNDVFSIKSTGIKSLDCVIYDRWGIKLSEFKTLTGTWDGSTSGGQKVTDGVYYYLVTLTEQDGTRKEEKGFIQLIRN